jgi:D-alanyl-D-alanine carboxypeptidase
MSEHNLGFAVDFNGVDDDFYKTKEYGWLVDHAADYGFIERYGKEWEEKTGVIFEPWHFRYVGVGSAKIIKDSGLCLEEYVVLNGGKGEKNQ